MKNQIKLEILQKNKLLNLQYNITKLKKDGVAQIIINKRFLEDADFAGTLIYEQETKIT